MIRSEVLINMVNNIRFRVFDMLHSERITRAICAVFGHEPVRNWENWMCDRCGCWLPVPSEYEEDECE